MSNDLQTTVDGAVRSSDLLCVRLRHLDLFSGIGGFALAAQRAGWNTIGFSEIEPYACKILKRHWPDVPNYGDIRNVRGVSADLITGGFPCQPYSLAGKRGGASDDRALWPEMHRVIAETRPAWVLGENVPGIVSMELDRVLDDLEHLGYAAWPLAIPACAVDARHRRERIWIVGWNSDAMRCSRNSGAKQEIQNENANANGICKTVADSRRNGQRPGKTIQWGASEWCEGSLDAANGLWWPPEPGVGRVANGIPNRVDRLRGLGNAIVPQVAETLMREMARTHNKQAHRLERE